MQKYIIITFILTLFPSCDFLNSPGKYSPSKIPVNMILLSTVFGQGQGIWLFNPTTFEIYDTVVTGGSWSVNLSPDHKILYTAWWDSETQISKVFVIDMETKKIIHEQEILNPNVDLDHTKYRLISMGGNPGIQILDAHTFEIHHE
jgi:WD40 repeat protein